MKTALTSSTWVLPTNIIPVAYFPGSGRSIPWSALQNNKYISRDGTNILFYHDDDMMVTMMYDDGNDDDDVFDDNV